MTHDLVILQQVPEQRVARLADVWRARAHWRRNVTRVRLVLLVVAAAAAVLDVILVDFVVGRAGAVSVDAVAWRRRVVRGCCCQLRQLLLTRRILIVEVRHVLLRLIAYR